MKKLLLLAAAALAFSVGAMPTQEEQKNAATIVDELMNPIVAEFTAKEKTAAEVGDTAMAYVKEANTEAAKYLLLKGAVWYFAQAKEDAKAVAAIAALGTQVKELPPEVLCNDILKPAIDHVSEQNMPGLFAQFRSAFAQMEIAKLGPSVRRGKADEPTRRRYAELLAVAGDWKGALDVFAKLDAAKDAAEAESVGKTLAQAGDFWWDYQPIEPTAADAIKAHAVDLYRKAIASGELTGLKKAVVEKRIAGAAGGCVADDGPGKATAPGKQTDEVLDGLKQRLADNEAKIKELREKNPACYINPRATSIANIETKIATMKDRRYCSCTNVKFVRDAFYCSKCSNVTGYRGRDVIGYGYGRCNVCRQQGFYRWLNERKNVDTTAKINVQIDELLKETESLEQQISEAKRSGPSGKAAAEKNIASVSSSTTSTASAAPKGTYKFNYTLDDKGNAILSGAPCVNPEPEGVLVVPDKIDGHTVTKFSNSRVFKGCDKMTRVVLPPHLEEILLTWNRKARPGGIFEGCSALESIEISKDNANYTSENGALYTKDKKKLLAYPKTRREIMLPRETTTVGANAFISCLFKTVKIPESVERVDYVAFWSCPNLEVVEIPQSVTWIGPYAFERSANMKRVVFHGDAPDAPTRYKANVFTGSSKDIVVEVKKGSKGWKAKGSTELPERWPTTGDASRPIRHIQ